jgi:hypothetical protein
VAVVVICTVLGLYLYKKRKTKRELEEASQQGMSSSPALSLLDPIHYPSLYEADNRSHDRSEGLGILVISVSKIDTSLVRRTRIRMCNYMSYYNVQCLFPSLPMKINIHDNNMATSNPRPHLTLISNRRNRDHHTLDSSPRNLASFLLLAFALILSIY